MHPELVCWLDFSFLFVLLAGMFTMFKRGLIHSMVELWISSDCLVFDGYRHLLLFSDTFLSTSTMCLQELSLRVRTSFFRQGELVLCLRDV